MKKRLFASLIVALTLFSCSSTQQIIAEGNDSQVTYEGESDLGENKIRVNGFESNKDLDTLMPLNYFGKISLNQDYVHDGKYSAKLTLLNQHLEQSTVGAPTLYQALYNESRKIYETDVRNTKAINAFMYNPNSIDYRIGVRPIIRSTFNWPGGPVLPTKWCPVKANSWNEISYEVNLDLIPEVNAQTAGNPNGNLSRLMVGVYFVFSRPEGDEQERTFYIDDFHVVKEEAK